MPGRKPAPATGWRPSSNKPLTPATLIIAYGNPLRGDDGLGRRAAEMLRERAFPGITILALHQLAPELAEDLSRAALAVFIDAREGGVPGEWRAEAVLPAPETPRPFTHQVSPATLLTAARTLYGHAPEALLYSMGGESFDYGEGLSAQVAAALPAMLEAIAERVLNGRAASPASGPGRSER